MRRLLVLTAAVVLSACSSMPAWVPGSGGTTLIDGDKGLDNFQRVGSQLTVEFNGQKSVDTQNGKFAQGPFALQFGNHGKAPGAPIKWRKVEVRPL